MQQGHDIHRISWYSSLVSKSLISIFLLLCIIIGLAGWFSTSKLYHDTIQKLETDTIYIADISAKAVALPLWNVDDELIGQNLKSLSKSQSFCGARVLDEQGKVFVAEQFPQVIAAGQFIYSTDILFSGLNQNEPKKIGTFVICASNDQTLKDVRSAIHIELIFFTIITLSVLAAYYFALRIITRPLLQIQKTMEHLDETLDPITDPQLLKNNEIGALAHSFNKMVYNLKQSYSALKTAMEKAIKADQAKTEFLANMSHELRTPLSIIIGMAQVIKQENFTEEQKQSFDIVKKSSQTLLHIVDDILDLSKIEAGEMHLESSPFNLTQKTKDMVDTLRPLAEQKGLTLEYKPRTSDTIWVLGDTVRYGQILANLIGNAIRYTEKGKIVVETVIDQIAANQIAIECRISDTGIGIAEDKLSAVFEKFSQADNSTKRLYGGTGLGLSITKQLLRLMHGDIKLFSQLGKGSTFIFTIPFKTTIEPEISQNTEIQNDSVTLIPLQNARILVAEDNPMNQILMQKLLTGLGIENIKIVNNGLEAVQEIEVQSFDLIFMDYNMPVMSGTEAIIAIRQNENPRIKDTPIIAITANAMSSDKEFCEMIGTNAFISKPFQIDYLKSIMRRWIAL
jgi:signal transduction histidine kinase/CheY-like chemotaxis protein